MHHESNCSKLDLIKNNIFLNSLNLSKNNLGDEFAIELANTLTINDTLYKVDISHNPIIVKGAQAVYKVLRESNDTIQSLGDIEA